MGESTKSWLNKFWPLLVQLAVWVFFAGMAWNAHQQMRSQVEMIEVRIREGERTDAAKSDSIIRLEEQVKVLIFEVQQLRHRLEDKKIVFQAESDNSGVVCGQYNERP
jgi:hypothetical protein